MPVIDIKDDWIVMEETAKLPRKIPGGVTGYLNNRRVKRYKTLPLHTPAMVIEPVRLQAEIYSDALRVAGYDPLTVDNELDAIRKLQEVRPSLILLNSSFFYCFDLVALIRVHENVYRSKTWIFLLANEQIFNLELMKMVDLVLMQPIGFAQMRDLALRFRRCAV